jgi:hypothetical protein
LPATASSRTTAGGPLKTQRFRNWKLIVFEIVVTALAASSFLAWEPGLLGWVGLVAGILIVWPLSRESIGLAINSRGVSLPRGRLARFPILALGRGLETGTAGLHHKLMVMAPWYGFQVVEIQGWFGSELLVFQSRVQRRRFVSAFEEICPDVSITKTRTRRLLPYPPLTQEPGRCNTEGNFGGNGSAAGSPAQIPPLTPPSP